MRILPGRAFSMPNQQQIIVICLYILDGSSPLLSLLLLSYLIQLCCTLGTTNTSDRHRPISPGAMKWTDPCQLHRPTSFSPRVVASDLPESTFCHCILRCPVLMSDVVLAGTSRHNIHSSLISTQAQVLWKETPPPPINAAFLRFIVPIIIINIDRLIYGTGKYLTQSRQGLRRRRRCVGRVGNWSSVAPTIGQLGMDWTGSKARPLTGLTLELDRLWSKPFFDSIIPVTLHLTPIW